MDKQDLRDSNQNDIKRQRVCHNINDFPTFTCIDKHCHKYLFRYGGVRGLDNWRKHMMSCHPHHLAFRRAYALRACAEDNCDTLWRSDEKQYCEVHECNNPAKSLKSTKITEIIDGDKKPFTLKKRMRLYHVETDFEWENERNEVAIRTLKALDLIAEFHHDHIKAIDGI